MVKGIMFRATWEQIMWCEEKERLIDINYDEPDRIEVLMAKEGSVLVDWYWIPIEEVKNAAESDLRTEILSVHNCEVIEEVLEEFALEEIYEAVEKCDFVPELCEDLCVSPEEIEMGGI